MGIKCEDCEEYRNEWCGKVLDSPHPDMLRDCQYFHERDKDIVKVIRCKDCKHYLFPLGCGHIDGMATAHEDGFCSYAERREG